jgi:hypothetical protein
MSRERRVSINSTYQCKEDVHLRSRRDFSHHRLAVREPAGDQEADAGLVEPEFPDVVVSDLVGPNTDESCGCLARELEYTWTAHRIDFGVP